MNNSNINSNSINNGNNTNDNNDFQRIVDNNGYITEIKKERLDNGLIKTTTTKKDPNGNIIFQTQGLAGGNSIFSNNIQFNLSSNNFSNNMNIFGTGINNIMSNMLNNITNAINNNLNMNFNDENVNNALDPAILNNLIVIKIDESELDENETDCIICLEKFKKDDDAIYLPCQHLFHKACLYEWFKIKDFCPYCKTKVTRENTDIYG